MLSPFRSSCLAASLLFTAGFVQAAAIQVNGAANCEVGNCSDPGTLSPGQSIGLTSFGFTFVLPDTDRFFISGTYSESGTAPSVTFSATAAYLGNSTNTASSNDVLSVDLLEMFAYNGSTSGTYSEKATLSQSNVASGSSVSGQLSFGGQGIGLLGPYTGIGSETLSASKFLSGFSSPALSDFNFTFTLAAGSPAVPEPANIGLSLVGLLAVCALVFYRRRFANLV